MKAGNALAELQFELFVPLLSLALEASLVKPYGKKLLPHRKNDVFLPPQEV